MNAILTIIFAAFKYIINVIFTDDLAVMSNEVRKILSNPVDAQKYINAIARIQAGEPAVTITLSNNEELTLIQ